MLDLIKDIELIESDGVNFVERIETGNVLAVSFNNVDDEIEGAHHAAILFAANTGCSGRAPKVLCPGTSLGSS